MSLSQTGNRVHWGRVWLVSIAVWTFLALYYAGLSYQWQRGEGRPGSFAQALIRPGIEGAIAVIFTPGLYGFARRYPIEISNWSKRIPLHVAALLLYAGLHATIRIFIYPPRAASGMAMARTLRTTWQLFLSNTYDDATTTYVPIVVIAQMIAYYQRYRDRELRAAQLETELVEARLQALKSQLQPHFLFNTLHSISALMHLDVEAADKMMVQLSELLRLSLETANLQECSLKHELEFLAAYLQIEQTRFFDRLSISIQVDPEAYDAKVPSMLMQPLAENAVRHGVSKRASGGRIEVKARRERERLLLSIMDNGPGFDFPATGLSSNTGLGLRNILRRLEGLYGAGFSFSVHRLGEGVEVSVSLPFERYELEMPGAGSLSRARSLLYARGVGEWQSV